jgi:diguanylate cyclase (GGDEF)-like protein
MARRDALTDALNRHAFQALAARRRSGESGSVVIVDIDDLKPINDRFGHASGDDAIRATARAIRSLVRSDDAVFRWGGDEFLVLLPGLGPQEAGRRFEELERRLAQAELPGVGAWPLRVSVGITPLESTEQLEAAVARADALMYERKRARKEGRKPPE